MPLSVDLGANAYLASRRRPRRALPRTRGPLAGDGSARCAPASVPDRPPTISRPIHGNTERFPEEDAALHVRRAPGDDRSCFSPPQIPPLPLRPVVSPSVSLRAGPQMIGGRGNAKAHATAPLSPRAGLTLVRVEDREVIEINQFIEIVADGFPSETTRPDGSIGSVGSRASSGRTRTPSRGGSEVGSSSASVVARTDAARTRAVRPSPRSATSCRIHDRQNVALEHDPYGHRISADGLPTAPGRQLSHQRRDSNSKSMPSSPCGSARLVFEAAVAASRRSALRASRSVQMS